MKVKRKPLSVLLTFCMVLALVPMAALAESGNTVSIATVEQLEAAIENQADDQVWELAAGTYELSKTFTISEPVNGETGPFIFPITADNLKIVGKGDVVITSSVTPDAATGGVWHNQNFLTIIGSGVTIENVDLKANKNLYYAETDPIGGVNKAVEVLGKDFSLKDVELLPVEGQSEDAVNSGSIYFSTADAGNAVLENVTVRSWVTARTDTVKNGTITLKNTTIDISNFIDSTTYATSASNDIFVSDGLSVLVDSRINLSGEIFNKVPAGTTVKLTEDYLVNGDCGLQIDPANKNITFDLNGFALKPGDDFTPNTENGVNNWRANLVSINGADGFTLTGGKLTADGKEAVRNVLNVQGSKGVVIDDVVLNHEGAAAGAPLIVNASEVTVTGKLDVVTGQGSWYGINVDNKGKEASLVFAEESTLTYTDNSEKELPLIQVSEGEDAPKVENKSDNFTLDIGEDGKIDMHKHTVKHVEAKSATTEAEGNIEYWYCEVCCKYFSDAAMTKEITEKDTVVAKLTPEVPPTGDSSNVVWMLMLIGISCMAMVGTTVSVRKKTYSK